MNVPACEKVLMKLKTECIEYLKKYASIEEIIRRDMKEIIWNSSYFGLGHNCSESHFSLI